MIRSKNILFFAFACLLLVACKRDKPSSPEPAKTFTVTVLAPQKVAKTTSIPTYIHYMPWFGSTEYSGGWHHWGSNADIIKDGKRDIPAVYHPLVDLYDSKDPAYLEYAFLCMKLGGADGVFIDYYSELNLNDYPFNFERTLAAIAMAEKVGLNYAVVYEDALLIQAANNNMGTQAEVLTKNYTYLKNN